jgi:predicted Fe-Mo cluster-binding NifX family protein
MEAESVDNPAMSAGGGAGIQAAQFVVERGAEAVVSGNVGPNAFAVFESAGVPVYLFGGGSVREAVEWAAGGERDEAWGVAEVWASQRRRNLRRRWRRLISRPCGTRLPTCVSNWRK